MPRKSKKNKLTNGIDTEDCNKQDLEPEAVDIGDEDVESTDESEDDSALFLTEKVEDTIFKTLLKIKNKDPEIYNEDHKFFNDSDFEVEDRKDAGPEKPFTYSDMVRETLLREGAEAFEDPDQKPEKGFSYNEEQDQLKREFLEASKTLDDDEFFTKSDAVDVIPEIRPAQIQNRTVRESELISRYWCTWPNLTPAASNEELDENEEFLKDYILNQRWREDRLENFRVDHSADKMLVTDLKSLRDDYDEEHVDKADEFEYKYNYRFEEQDGAKIIGYPRNIEDSARKKDERRRLKRQEKRRRKQEEKVRRDEEIKRLKNLRKSAREKMQEIASAAGVPVSHDAIDLDAPFDPQQHERDMKKIIGLGYDRDELDDEDPDEDPETWWRCDDCGEGIPAGATHFDCKACENFSLCEGCLQTTAHEHADFSSKKVPVMCAPPDQFEESFDLDYEDYIADMPVKFKYRKVEPVPCDLNTILEKSDKELNQMMPLRSLIGYDVPGQPQKPFKNKRKRSDESESDSTKKKHYPKAMTKYNVNRDRLSAFGLDGKQSKKKPKKLNNDQSE